MLFTQLELITLKVCVFFTHLAAVAFHLIVVVFSLILLAEGSSLVRRGHYLYGCPPPCYSAIASRPFPSKGIAMLLLDFLHN